MNTFHSAGRDISYLDEGSGPPLVFLHAFPLSPLQWQEQIRQCAPRWRCIAPAAPGFGCDPFPEPPSLAKIGDDLVALLDELKITEPIVLCGLSMGGYAGQWFAHRFPQKVRALVLCDTRASADDDATRQKRDENIAFAASHTTTEMLERLRPGLLGDFTLENRPAVVETVNRLALGHQPARLAEGTVALRDRPDMRAWLADIAMPTLLVFGDGDKLAPQAEIEILQGIPGSRLEVLPNAGHLSNLEAPEAFNTALKSFLETL